jgi:hypothetical protein
MTTTIRNIKTEGIFGPDLVLLHQAQQGEEGCVLIFLELSFLCSTHKNNGSLFPTQKENSFNSTPLYVKMSVLSLK